jgi:hypothetical protein
MIVKKSFALAQKVTLIVFISIISSAAVIGYIGMEAFEDASIQDTANKAAAVATSVAELIDPMEYKQIMATMEKNDYHRRLEAQLGRIKTKEGLYGLYAGTADPINGLVCFIDGVNPGESYFADLGTHFPAEHLPSEAFNAVMAHWGTAYTAGSPEKDAYNCVAASLMMRKTLLEMNKNRTPADLRDPPIHIGMGINTGIVTTGQIGSDVRMEYTVIGDPVNIASRIETLTKTLGADILISENTWELVKDDFVCEEMPLMQVKGKEKPVRVFAVINFANGDHSPKNLTDVRKQLGMNAQGIEA